MSSKGVPKKDGTTTKTRESEFYSTPVSIIEEFISLPEVSEVFKTWEFFLEPCVGDGAMIQGINNLYPQKIWTTCDIRPECQVQMEVLSCAYRLNIYHLPGDFLEQDSKYKWDVCITNPPFSLAQEFINKTLTLADHNFYLLRLGTLGSKKRLPLWEARKPDLYIMHQRPSFTNDGKTDSDYYMWVHFHSEESGKYKVY